MLYVGGNLFLSGLGRHSQKEFWNLPALLSLDTSIPIENPEEASENGGSAARGLGALILK